MRARLCLTARGWGEGKRQAIANTVGGAGRCLCLKGRAGICAGRACFCFRIWLSGMSG
jgi:hypothetical protein